MRVAVVPTGTPRDYRREWWPASWRVGVVTHHGQARHVRGDEWECVAASGRRWTLFRTLVDVAGPAALRATTEE